MKLCAICMLIVISICDFSLATVQTQNLYGYFHASDYDSYHAGLRYWFDVADKYGGPGGAPALGNTTSGDDSRAPSYSTSQGAFYFGGYERLENKGTYTDRIAGTNIPLTLEMWANCKTLSHDAFMINIGGETTTNTKMAIGYFGSSLSSWSYRYRDADGELMTVSTGQTVSLNEWHHFVLTYDGGDYRAYCDGQHLPLADRTDTLFISTPTVRIGAGNSAANDGAYDGYVSVFRLYTDALSPAEVAANYSFGMVTGVPEPMTILLLGLGGLLMRRWENDKN